MIVGFGALVRPETPLLLMAAGLVLLAKWWRPADWRKLARAGVLMGLGLLLPLLPWAARNWRTLHEVQFLAPRYRELPGDFAPLGFNAWTGTWLWRFGDVYLTLWNLDDQEIPIETVPARAFDSPQERTRVAELLEPYNDTLDAYARARPRIRRNRRRANGASSLSDTFHNSAAALARDVVHAAHRAAALFRASISSPARMGR